MLLVLRVHNVSSYWILFVLDIIHFSASHDLISASFAILCIVFHHEVYIYIRQDLPSPLSYFFHNNSLQQSSINRYVCFVPGTLTDHLGHGDGAAILLGQDPGWHGAPQLAVVTVHLESGGGGGGGYRVAVVAMFRFFFFFLSVVIFFKMDGMGRRLLWSVILLSLFCFR